MTNLADELERLAKEAHPAPWIAFVDKGFVLALMPAGRPGDVCTFTADEQSSASAKLFVTYRYNHDRILSALRGEQERETAADVVQAPRKLIEDVLTDYIMMAGQPRPDPLYARDVEKLGSRIGYGAMMQSASASWSATVRGGEFCVGPCRAVAISTRDRLAALLPPPPKGTSHE